MNGAAFILRLVASRLQTSRAYLTYFCCCVGQIPSMQAQAALEVAPETFKMALYTPPQLAMMAVDYVHAATGMPYWMTIVAITVGIRTAILPVGLLAARNGARTAAMKPEMDALQAAIKVTHRFRTCMSWPHGKRECVLLYRPISKA